MGIEHELFDTDLLAIEKEHIMYFQERVPKESTEEHERLCNHYTLQFGGYGVQFAFHPDSDLPEYIKQQCLKLFDRHFTPRSPQNGE